MRRVSCAQRSLQLRSAGITRSRFIRRSEAPVTAGRVHGSATLRLAAAELRLAVSDLADQGDKLWLPLYQGLLAQVEDGQDVERAAATIGEVVAHADQIGGYWATAFLHRIRGEILLSAIRRIPRRLRKPSSPPSRSRSNKGESFSCKPHCCWRSFISQPAAPPTLTPCSRRRLKDFRRRRNFLRSKKPKLFSLHSRNRRSEERRSVSKRPLIKKSVEKLPRIATKPRR